MTHDEIIELARQAGIKCRTEKGVFCSKYIDGIIDDDLEAFARLVAEKEREACVKACEEVWLDTVEAQTHNDKCVKAIRAMGQA
jgi:hypothetical protein